MRRFDGLGVTDTDFWAIVQYVSETLGYSHGGRVNSFSLDDIKAALQKKRLFIDEPQLLKIKRYVDSRATLLNDRVEPALMDAAAAKNEYEKLLTPAGAAYSCKRPLNKQKGEMRQIAYFTAIINMLAEKTIKGAGNGIQGLGFNDDPKGLVYVVGPEGRLIGSTSRRYDGALPDIVNPLMIWEIKEYYYAMTFGSRVADGVYETQLDGHEFKQIEEATGIHIEHVFFIDGHRTWWVQGKSYLCRIIDALNRGLVDEVIVGREVLTGWPQLIRRFL
jgi:hypothetical protein